MAQTTQEWLAKLVGFNTVSSESNLELIRHVEDYLESVGIKSTLVYNDEKTKANLVATIGPNVADGIVLSGHSDVVPVEGQDWSSDPFTLREDEKRLYGRGSADMKGFIAACLAYVPKFLAADLKRPIHLAFSYDEEVGCLGVQSMIRILPDTIAPPRLVVIGEPTMMQVATAHKGQHVSKTRIWGREAHSSRPDDGVNAVVVASDLIQFITKLADEAKTSGASDDAFTPPYTSFNIGPISGGSAFNIISNYCEFDWEFRPIPNGNPKEILDKYNKYLKEVVEKQIQEKFPECRVENEVWAYLPPLKSEPGSDGESLALKLAERNDTTVVAFGTEGGHFQSLDYPVVVCGPGDIAQAHKPDEFIEISQLNACERFLDRVIEALRW
jgi:acetylornithine deacetylase